MKKYEFIVLRNDTPVRKLMVVDSTVPTIGWTGSASINRTLRIDVEQDPDENWLTDRIQAYRVNEDGSRLALGRFIVTTPTYSISENGVKKESLECYDLNYLMTNLQILEDTLTINAGTPYISAVQTQLLASGVTRIVADDTDAIIPVDKEFEVGTSRYDVIKSLLEDINYNPLWFDGTGTAMLSSVKTVKQTANTHIYDRHNAIPMYVPMEQSADLYDAANVFVCIVNSADLAQTMRSVAENNFMDSPLCIARRGVRIASVEVVDSIASQSALDLRAKNRMLQSLMSTATYSWSTDGDAEDAHGLFDSVILNREGAGLMEEQDWSLECKSGGQMTHTGKKVFYSLD